WPGGNFVSGYDWKDGVGPRDQRPPRKNPAWKGIEHNDVGIDEFMVFCRRLDAEPYIALNTGLGSSESARQEVEYCNGSVDTPMGKWRAQNGHPKPYNVTWWAVGNEMYGNWQLGNVPLEQYVKRHNDFVETLRTVDPQANYVGVGEVGRWSEQMLTHCADYMNHISEHFYNEDNKDLRYHINQIPNNVKRIADAHRRYRQRIDALKGKDIKVALDEWNYWYGPNLYGELGVRYYMRDALGIAAGLHEYFRNSDIYIMANYAQTVNVIGCIKTTKTDAAFETTALPLMLYRNHYGAIPIEISGNSDPLDVVAAWTEERKAITVGLINPTENDLALTVDWKDVILKGSADLWCIKNQDPMAYNEPGKEPQVSIETRELKNISDTLIIPALSINLYRLPVK
ncbi:MAG: hypothetical protein JW860_12770, partial [Sedimentisphaerales bacterium]|nr:hypothetical protein [Sedimentisphaerales bacterium]